MDEKSLAQFVHHLNRCRCPPQGYADRASLTQGTHLFLKYLRDTGISTTFPVALSVAAEPPLLSRFCEWMRLQRGTCVATLSRYRRYVRELLTQLGDAPSRWDAHGLRAFVLNQGRRCGSATVQACAATVRMFVRFLIAEGHCAVGLDAAIPRVAHWRLAMLPRYLPPNYVERVIASCDPASPVGLRDRAILLLLARLGLRAGDVAHLRLPDIDWRESWIQVRGKSRYEARLPLTQEVGQAVVDYLQHGGLELASIWSLSAVELRCGPSILIVPLRRSSPGRSSERESRVPA